MFVDSKKIVASSVMQAIQFKSELRHRFYLEAKAAYWHSYEDGSASPETVIMLNTSINRALDKSNQTIDDWSFVQDALPLTSIIPAGLQRVALFKRLSYYFVC